MTVKQKADQITKRIAAIDEKMKQLLLQKKELEKQLRDMEEQEILSVVRNNGVNIETLNSDLALARLLRENNLTREDILELVSPQQTTDQISSESSDYSAISYQTTHISGGNGT